MTNAATGAGICNASVYATEGSYMGDLPLVSDAPCMYGDPDHVGGAGDFHVTVTAPGFEPAMQSLQITTDQCGNIDQDTTLTVTLIPAR